MKRERSAAVAGAALVMAAVLGLSACTAAAGPSAGTRPVAGPTTHAATTGSTASSPTTQAAGSGASPLLGSYNGASNPSGARRFAAETDTTASVYSDYLDGSSWSSMVGSRGRPPRLISRLRGKLGSMRLLLSVPLVNAGYSSDQAAMAAYANAAPDYEAYFRTLARNLVATGFSDAIIRLMWEPDSGIYSNDDLTSASNYATLWRDAHSAMMSVHGAAFQWAWYWGDNFDAQTNAAAYPGDAYVDYVTFDIYDQSWDSACGVPYAGADFTSAQAKCLWSDDYSKELAGLTAFAAAHHEPIGIGEWGVIKRPDGHGGGDDPTWVNEFTAWMRTNHVVWASYFNFDDGGNDCVLAAFPGSLAAYKADLG